MPSEQKKYHSQFVALLLDSWMDMARFEKARRGADQHLAMVLMLIAGMHGKRTQSYVIPT